MLYTNGAAWFERERSAEVGSRLLGRHVADPSRFDSQSSNKWIERDGDGEFPGEIRGSGSGA